MKKDIVIASMEFARQKMTKGEFIDRRTFVEFLLKEGFLDPKDIDYRRALIDGLFYQIFSFQEVGFTIESRFMSIDSYLGLIDYEELQLAREESKRAREEARLATEAAEKATTLADKSLWWTRVSVFIATLVGIIQIIASFI